MFITSRSAETIVVIALSATFMAALAHCQQGCLPAGTAKPAAYEAELVMCSEKARSLCESVTCENEVRTRYVRPMRPMPATCLDGGVK
jgi:hypothetical protein